MADFGAQLSIRADNEEIRKLCGRIMDRIRMLGQAESERRLGYSLEKLGERTGDWFDIVPGDDGIVRIQPSVRFDEVLAALG